MGSFDSFNNPRIPPMPSSGSVPQEVQFWAKQVTVFLNGLPPFSRFSWTTPNSYESAQQGTIGINMALPSVASGLWFKQLGSGATGWVAVA
jgi:hypothetical protein